MYLIADSGGTQTDWCHIDAKGEKHFFTTDSFHPVQWTDTFIKEYEGFWKHREHLKRCKVVFYGAGCLNPLNQERLKELFLRWGFNQIEIYSDIEGACVAALGDKDGVVGILGTGSVLCEYQNQSLKSVIGGFGYLLGDEGSGYHFGKMVLNHFLNAKFSEKLTNELISVFGNRTSILSNVYGDSGKQFIGSIAAKLGELNSNEEINQIHKENIQLFVENYLKNKDLLSEDLYFIGRYAENQKDNLIKVLVDNDLCLGKCIGNPINDLAKYHSEKHFNQ